MSHEQIPMCLYHPQENFVACGSSDSEVTVWDVTNLSAPIIPGKKLSLGADVSCVEFNRWVVGAPFCVALMASHMF